jgi:hypothetical protein
MTMPPIAPSPFLVYPGMPVPAGGALLISSPTTAMPIVSVAPVSSQMLVPGTLSKLGTFWVWKPTQGLGAGQYYVHLSNPNPPVPAVVATVPATLTVIEAPIAPPSLTGSLAVKADRKTTASACCTKVPGFAEPPAGCFPVETTVQASVIPSLALVDPAPSTSQFLFALRPAGSSADPPFQRWPPGPAFFHEQAEQYCVDVLALDINTGAVHRYDELTARCLPHGGLEPIGRFVEPVDAGLDRSICPLPPAELAWRWCMLNGAACAADRAAAGCVGYGHVCRDEPLPAPPPRTFSGAAGGAARGMSGAGGVPGEAGSAASTGLQPTPNGAHASGCSLASARSATPAPAWLALIALILVRRCTSRRSRPSATWSRPAACRRPRGSTGSRSPRSASSCARSSGATARP